MMPIMPEMPGVPEKQVKNASCRKVVLEKGDFSRLSYLYPPSY